MIIACPCCENSVEVTVDPGEEPVYYPNDRAHPGAPPAVEQVEGCECREYLEHHGEPDDYDERVLERVWERREDARSIAADARYDAMADEKLMREAAGG